MKETKNTVSISDGKEPSIIPMLQRGNMSQRAGSEALRCGDEKPGLGSGWELCTSPSPEPCSQEAWPCKTLRTSVSPSVKSR